MGGGPGGGAPSSLTPISQLCLPLAWQLPGRQVWAREGIPGVRAQLGALSQVPLETLALTLSSWGLLAAPLGPVGRRPSSMEKCSRGAAPDSRGGRKGS